MNFSGQTPAGYMAAAWADVPSTSSWYEPEASAVVQHPDGEEALQPITISRAVQRAMVIVRVPCMSSDRDFLELLKRREDDVKDAVDTITEELRSVKLVVRSNIRFFRTNVDTESRQETEGGFSSDPIILASSSELDFDDIVASLSSKVEGFNKHGSGWIVDRILTFKIVVVAYRPFEGSSFIPTPAKLRGKQAILNVRNSKDNMCFAWSVLAALHPLPNKKHSDRVHHYRPFLSELNFHGLEFPLAVSDVGKFERLNPAISIHVYFYDDKDGVIPLYVSKFRERPHHVDLLLFEDGRTFHYTLIKSMSRLIAGRTKGHHKAWICPYCLHPYSSEQMLQNHVSVCQVHAPQVVVFPKETHVEFNHAQRQHPVPVVLYLDFESFLVPSEEQGVSNTHEPSGYCLYRVSVYPEFQKDPIVYSGANVMENFYRTLKVEMDEISKILRKSEAMHPLTPDQRKRHYQAKVCSTCGKTFTKSNPKVRHHDHVTGESIGPYCNKCNLQLKFRKRRDKTFIPIFCHNLKNYDAHLILKHFQVKYFESDPIEVIPNNQEKYISFSIGSLRFLDSFQFLNSSLDNLVSILLKSGKDKFVNTQRHLGQNDLVFQKGVFCYEYMTGPEKFTETCLPPREAFYSELNEEMISKGDYQRAEAIWEAFGCKTIRDYHDFYLKTDVLLLADVFENFRELCRKNFDLDPAHYYTLPGFSWDACLKFTDVKLEIMKDIDMVLFVENAIRGGISVISHRHAQANNPYMEEGYDYSKPHSYITYLDANALYSWAMTNQLPIGDFKFLTEEEIDVFNLDRVPDDGEKGYILEVDLRYPSSLHASHNHYPLAPQRMIITQDMLSPYAKSFGCHSKCEKLVPNLLDKEKYVLHFKNLRLYLELGMEVRKTHRILEFSQSAWMKPYIELCTSNRQAAQSDFEKDLWKLMCNAIFGKSMEQVRNRLNIKLVSDPKKLRKLVAKPSLKDMYAINDELALVKLAKAKLVLSKPTYVGFTILDISKTLMYHFHYKIIRGQYGDKATLLFTDTDSLCYVIETPDLYVDMLEKKHLYDTSNFEPGDPLYSTENKKVVGKFKSETAGKAPLEFVGLRPKMYSLLLSRKEKPKLTAKGIKKSYISKSVTHAQFAKTLKTRAKTFAEFKLFRSTEHLLKTLDIHKVCLSAYDDKRYLLDDGITSLAYGHYLIRRQ